MAISKITSASLDQSSGAPAWDASGNTTLTGNLTISGTGKRIIGDFSNATHTSRVLVQTSTANANTILGIIPNGTATTAQLNLYYGSDPTNTSCFQLSTQSDRTVIASSNTGSGSYLPMTFYTSSSERLRIDTAGNVGIGTSTQANRLEVSGPRYIPASGWTSVLSVRSTDAQGAETGGGIALGGVFSGTAQTDFAQIAGLKEDSTNGNYGGILALYSRPNGGALTERMRIDAAGNVGIRTTPSAWISAYPAIDMGTMTGIYGRTDLTPEFATSLNGYRSASGDWLYKTNNPASRHTQGYGYHVFDSASSGTAGNVISFTTVLSVKKDETVSLQGSTSVAGTGITFPATQNPSSNANTLDDYEEGTWTPTIIGTGSNPTYTTSLVNGVYRKIGSLVYIELRIDLLTISGGSGSLRIGGLPFSTTSNIYPAANVAYKNNFLTYGPDYGRIVTNFIELYRSNNTAETTMQVGYLSGSSAFILSGCYTTT